jgi:hypothetical protein
VRSAVRSLPGGRVASAKLSGSSTGCGRVVRGLKPRRPAPAERIDHSPGSARRVGRRGLSPAARPHRFAGAAAVQPRR